MQPFNVLEAIVYRVPENCSLFDGKKSRGSWGYCVSLLSLSLSSIHLYWYQECETFVTSNTAAKYAPPPRFDEARSCRCVASCDDTLCIKSILAFYSPGTHWRVDGRSVLIPNGKVCFEIQCQEFILRPLYISSPLEKLPTNLLYKFSSRFGVQHRRFAQVGA